MNIIEKTGLGLFIIAILIFTASLGLDQFVLSEENIGKAIDNEYHRQELIDIAQSQGILNKSYASSFSFVPAFKNLLKDTQKSLKEKAKEGLPEGVKKSKYTLPSWRFKDYTFTMVRRANSGPVADHPFLFFMLTIGMGLLGGLLYILPQFNLIPGIKHNQIYHSSMTRGLRLNWRGFFLGAAIIGVLLYGVYYMGKDYIWTALTAVIALLIVGLVLFYQKQAKRVPAKSASPTMTGWLGIITGVYLIGFYILLYWSPQHMTSWIIMVDPISKALSGGRSQPMVLIWVTVYYCDSGYGGTYDG